ncbi:MAG: hypothetical protein HF978_18145 [Desulfobacteraceae bacterium]|nr:hypothetical protein [Desulfobacteraceae bacterium]MBC2757470.1 hypothetical protein [Desulfobacteraceae bacterium]
MEKKETNVNNEMEESKKRPVPIYEPPKIITYTSEEILEEIGPAHACSPFDPGCGVLG